MNISTGERVRLLRPYWNHDIWGFHGTILGPSHSSSGRMELRLDRPNPRHRSDEPTKYIVHVTEDEIEPLYAGRSLHNDWSQEDQDGTYGHCDTCGQPVEANGCTANPTHEVAIT